MSKVKIISGGQTGADYGGLLGARDIGLDTGGWCPKDWKTENGSNPKLAEFGLKQHDSPHYRSRTRRNAKEADFTLWFGRTGSPGYKCTNLACKDYNKDLFVIKADSSRLMADAMVKAMVDRFLLKQEQAIINVAGNRESTNKGIEKQVRKFIKTTFASYTED